jgi:hypothetical protein
VARKKKNPEGRNDVTLATSLAGITPRRKPKTPVSKKEAMVQMADDELTADIMTKAIHSPLAQEGLDRLGVKNLTRLFTVPSTTYGSYYPKGHKLAKEFKKFGHVGDKRFHKEGKESIAIATKDISSPSQFRTTATHEYGHASPDYETRQGTATREAILQRQDMRDPDPKEVAIAKKYFDKRPKGLGAKADKILDEAQAAAKKRLIKKGIYIRPPKVGTNERSPKRKKSVNTRLGGG